MKYLLCSLLILPMSLHAQDFATRIKATFEQTDKNFDIDCYYSRNQSFKLITPAGETKRTATQLSREFIVETSERKVPMTFTLTKNNRDFDYSVLLNNAHSSKGKLDKRDFLIAPVSDQAFNKEFETNHISCSVNFAYAAPFSLKDGDYHFNVHPHTIYDWQAKLKNVVEGYLNNEQFQSIVLLETGNGRGNLVDIARFMNNEDLKLPASTLKSDLTNVPEATPIIVSPSGNNRFKIEAENELNITFSGGNHNYCIWNSTRQVLIGLMNSKSEAKVNFHYDMKAIVAQVRGMEGLAINFNKNDVNKSNLLFDLLSNTSRQNGYHFSYLIYFRNLFAQEYAGMYREFKVNYDAPGYKESFTMHGGGTKDLEVNFSYF